MLPLALIPVLTAALAIGAQKSTGTGLFTNLPAAKPGQDPLERLAEIVDWWMRNSIFAQGMDPDDPGSWYEFNPMLGDTSRLQQVTGLEVLGWGAFRIVFAIGKKHAVKIPINSSALAMTLNERD